MSNQRILAGEIIGTTILMLGGPGTAILGINRVGDLLAVSLGFGFALLIAAYAVGHASGCHINPAVTLGMWLSKKTESAKVPVYVAGQAIGAALGGGLIYLMMTLNDTSVPVTAETFATNRWTIDAGFAGFWPMVIAEVVLTGLLVFVVLSTARKGYVAAVSGLHAGITLALIHFISIPIDNTSVNPARSFGTAIYAGGEALTQLWAFIVFPLVGALLGVAAWRTVDEVSVEAPVVEMAPVD